MGGPATASTSGTGAERPEPRNCWPAALARRQRSRTQPCRRTRVTAALAATPLGRWSTRASLTRRARTGPTCGPTATSTWPRRLERLERRALRPESRQRVALLPVQRRPAGPALRDAAVEPRRHRYRRRRRRHQLRHLPHTGGRVMATTPTDPMDDLDEGAAARGAVYATLAKASSTPRSRSTARRPTGRWKPI